VVVEVVEVVEVVVVVEVVEVVEVVVVALQFGLACCTWRWCPGSCLVSWDPQLALPSSVHSSEDPNPALVLLRLLPFLLCHPARLPLPFHGVLLVQLPLLFLLLHLL